MSGIVGWCSGRIGYKKSHSHNQPKRGPALLFETDPQGPIRRISLKNRRVLENSTFLVAPSGTKPRRGQEKVRDSCQIHSAMPMMSRGSCQGRQKWKASLAKQLRVTSFASALTPGLPSSNTRCDSALDENNSNWTEPHRFANGRYRYKSDTNNANLFTGPPHICRLGARESSLRRSSFPTFGC